MPALTVLSRSVQWIILTALKPSFRRFEKDLDDPKSAQKRVLREIVQLMSSTEYGKKLQLKATDDVQTYRAKVPLVTYEDLTPWIDRQKVSHEKIIAPESVKLFEKTSGSSGGSKFIPYTPSLLRSFNQLMMLWLYDLLKNGPQLKSGKTFFSLSPPFQDERETANGIPLSLDDDSEYLSPLMRFFFGSRFILPKGLKKIRDPFQYKRVLAAHLLIEKDLEILFVWNPTYLSALLDFIKTNRQILINDLDTGVIQVPDNLEFRFPKQAKSRQRLLLTREISWSEIWPALKLISCWTDAGAAFFIPRIKKEFPGVLIQGKGLLATEAPMTLPLFNVSAPVPLVNEIYFEFISQDGAILEIQELKDNEEYEIVISQKGGLCRYRIQDKLRVCGFFRNTPCLRFLGRNGDTSDMVGEKLNETFVRQIVERAFQNIEDLNDRFAFLLPVQREDKPSHYIFITRKSVSASDLEKELLEAFHYKQARLLGQLDGVSVLEHPDPQELYYSHFQKRGMKWGDIKYSTLLRLSQDPKGLLETAIKESKSITTRS